MLLASKFLFFRRREILGMLSITLYVLQLQVFWHAEMRKKIPLALTVEKRDVIGVTGTITIQSPVPSAGAGSCTSLFFSPEGNESTSLY